jgi:hypothetical protein
MVFSTIKKRFLELVCEPDGKLSLSRSSALATLVSTIVWVSYCILKSPVHALPDLTGPAVFNSAGAAHYGLGKYLGMKHDEVTPADQLK